MSWKLSGSAVAVVLALGCAKGTATTSGTAGVSPASAPVAMETIVGQYTLVAVDGHALPYTSRAAAAPARSILSGSFLLNSNGTFRLQTVYDASDSAPASSGTCYTEGNEVKMVWDGGGLTNLTLRGDTAFLKREGSTYSYLRKR